MGQLTSNIAGLFVGEQKKPATNLRPAQITKPTQNGELTAKPQLSKPNSNMAVAKKNISENTRPNSAGATRGAHGATAKALPVNPSPKVGIGKKLKIPNVEDKLVEFILDEIVDSGQHVKFSDIGKK